MSGLDASWYTLNPTQVTLGAGEVREIDLQLVVPVDCGLTVFDYPVHVAGTSPTLDLDLEWSMDGTLFAAPETADTFTTGSR